VTSIFFLPLLSYYLEHIRLLINYLSK